jgi:hypothetical protein
VSPKWRAITDELRPWWRAAQIFIRWARAGVLERLLQEYLGNVDNLSAINRAKYRYVSWSFRGLLVTVVAYCLLLAWGTAAGAA